MNAPDTFRLARYIALLVLDEERLKDYVKNPKGRKQEMMTAGLSEWERILLTIGSFEIVCKYLVDPSSAPAPPDDLDPGSLAPTS